MIPCPACGRDAEASHPTLHHFLCSYVGPDYDYEADGETVICPKCHRPLVAEGQDFEVIGQSFRCIACGKEFLG